MFELIDGSGDPRDVSVTFSGTVAWREGSLVLRVVVADGTDAEACEVDCRVSDSTVSSHPLDARSIEDALAQHIDMSWPPEHRLPAVRALAEAGGEYFLAGNADLGLYVSEPPSELAA
jgi:hypothetical protein